MIRFSDMETRMRVAKLRESLHIVPILAQFYLITLCIMKVVVDMTAKALTLQTKLDVDVIHSIFVEIC